MTHADTYNIIPKCDKRQVKCVPIAPGLAEYSFGTLYSTHSALCGQAVSDIRLEGMGMMQDNSNNFKEEHHNEELYGKPIKH